MDTTQSTRALTLSTLAFAISFAVWGMLAPLAKTFQTQMSLTEQQAWMLIAVPVLLGSLGRLPMGMLTDRYGGRIVFSALLVFSALPALLLSFAHDFTALLVGGFALGFAGTSFAVGIGFTSRWFPPERQGLALGVYGSGNIGQSIALFSVPILTALWGWQTTFRLFGVVTLVYGIVFFLLARDAPTAVKPKTVRQMLVLLATNPMAWLLSLFYFVTFGGFVALSIGLPKLLQEIFQLTAQDAGLRVAGFVLLATASRPIGGLLSDRIGGARLLALVFAGTAIFAIGMTFEHIVPFTIGALGVAGCIGLGNGAVFKLVPQFFPRDTGAVTGLVGAMGGLGGFFPPLVLGIIRTQTGAYDLGFLLLSLFCFICLALNALLLMGRSSAPQATLADASQQ